MQNENDHVLMGALLREVRRTIGLSQEKMASAMSITQSQLSRMEAGSRRILAAELLMAINESGANYSVTMGDGAPIEISSPAHEITIELHITLSDM